LGDLSHKAKENESRLAHRDIHAFGLIRRWSRSKGGAGIRTKLRVVREEGQAMVEYAAILGLVAATLVLAFSSLGATTLHLFDEVVTQWP
jgi:Flp pilus assembly pilin Flp